MTLDTPKSKYNSSHTILNFIIFVLYIESFGISLKLDDSPVAHKIYSYIKINRTNDVILSVYYITYYNIV